MKDESGPPSEQFKPDDTVETHGKIATVVNEEYESVKGQNAWIYLPTSFPFIGNVMYTATNNGMYYSM